MKAVVIGGQGFLGAEIVRALLEDGASVTISDRYADAAKCARLFGRHNVETCLVDVLDPEELRHCTQGADQVYHMAGKLGTSELEDEVISAIHVNVIGAVNVFEACVKNSVPVVFYPSKPNVWLNTYTITKFASEQFAELYSSSSDTHIQSLRYFNAYGPNQCIGPIRKIIPTFALQALRGQPVEVYGDGEQVVDMVYSLDLGRITVDFTTKARCSKPIDCGRGIGLSVNEVAEAVNRITGNTAGIKHLKMRRGETPKTILVADIEPLRQALPGLKFEDWLDSLALTIDWYDEHYVSAEKVSEAVA